MTLPSNFWEEFETRLDARLDARLALIEKKLGRLETTTKQVVQWTQRQDILLERETTKAIFKHLEQECKGSLVVVPTRFPKVVTDWTATDPTAHMTELDGTVVLTNNPDYKTVVRPTQKPAPAFSSVTSTTAHTYKLVIVEAKQHLTMNKYTGKNRQRRALEDLIQKARNDPLRVPEHLREIGLHAFEPHVGIYFGCMDMDDAPKQDMEATFKHLRNTSPWSGWVDYSGLRFDVKDVQNDFGEALYASGGGRRRKNDIRRQTQERV